jgi:hypothetical protein
MKIICDGDSWTFGSEIRDPALPKRSPDWIPENDSFRVQRIWPTILGSLLGADVVNLSRPSDDNRTILTRTMSYLSEYLASGAPPEELLVIVGWSSPERNSFWWKDDNHSNRFRLWPTDPNFERPMMKKFWEMYVSYLWNEEEYIPRFVMDQLTLQNFLQANGIRWLTFNAFYGFCRDNIDIIVDGYQLTTHLKNATTMLRNEGGVVRPVKSFGRANRAYGYGSMWDQIDPIRCYRKDQPNNTFKDHVASKLPKEDQFYGLHPSPQGHLIWAKELAKYLKDQGV